MYLNVSQARCNLTSRAACRLLARLVLSFGLKGGLMDPKVVVFMWIAIGIATGWAVWKVLLMSRGTCMTVGVLSGVAGAAAGGAITQIVMDYEFSSTAMIVNACVALLGAVTVTALSQSLLLERYAIYR